MLSALAPRRLSFDELGAAVGRYTPAMFRRPGLRACLGGYALALCLHRVASSLRASDWQPALCIAPQALDDLIELLLSALGSRERGRLTVSFDDGYGDAAEYIASRAPRFPSVDFLFFVCPDKLEHRAGFRWDLVEELLRSGAPAEAARSRLFEPMQLELENQRPELLALGDHPDYRLVTVEQARALTAAPNVALGNHTNLHGVPASLPMATVVEEYGRSQEQFARLFGAPPRHFAFPFGTPRWQFDARHVEVARRFGIESVWSTEGRPYLPSERRPGSVLPRYPVDGRWSAPALAGWIASRAVKHRVLGTRHHFP
jgi:peptidoglycan/xylan/chitin deacetylase (PgdA/CDA1 family)